MQRFWCFCQLYNYLFLEIKCVSGAAILSAEIAAIL